MTERKWGRRAALRITAVVGLRVPGGGGRACKGGP